MASTGERLVVVGAAILAVQEALEAAVEQAAEAAIAEPVLTAVLTEVAEDLVEAQALMADALETLAAEGRADERDP